MTRHLIEKMFSCSTGTGVSDCIDTCVHIFTQRKMVNVISSKIQTGKRTRLFRRIRLSLVEWEVMRHMFHLTQTKRFNDLYHCLILLVVAVCLSTLIWCHMRQDLFDLFNDKSLKFSRGIKHCLSSPYTPIVSVIGIDNPSLVSLLKNSILNIQPEFFIVLMRAFGTIILSSGSTRLCCHFGLVGDAICYVSNRIYRFYKLRFLSNVKLYSQNCFADLVLCLETSAQNRIKVPRGTF